MSHINDAPLWDHCSLCAEDLLALLPSSIPRTLLHVFVLRHWSCMWNPEVFQNKLPFLQFMSHVVVFSFKFQYCNGSLDFKCSTNFSVHLQRSHNLNFESYLTQTMRNGNGFSIGQEIRNTPSIPTNIKDKDTVFACTWIKKMKRKKVMTYFCAEYLQCIIFPVFDWNLWKTHFSGK